MMTLTKLNNETFRLNTCLVEQIQSHPDTTITLINGKKLVVKESEQEVAEMITYFYKKIGLMPNIQKAGELSE